MSLQALEGLQWFTCPKCRTTCGFSPQKAMGAIKICPECHNTMVPGVVSKDEAIQRIVKAEAKKIMTDA